MNIPNFRTLDIWEDVMEVKEKKVGKKRRRVEVAGGAADEARRVELDAVDIEILLTSGHYDDCCPHS